MLQSDISLHTLQGKPSSQVMPQLAVSSSYLLNLSTTLSCQDLNWSLQKKKNSLDQEEKSKNGIQSKDKNIYAFILFKFTHSKYLLSNRDSKMNMLRVYMYMYEENTHQ